MIVADESRHLLDTDPFRVDLELEFLVARFGEKVAHPRQLQLARRGAGTTHECEFGFCVETPPVSELEGAHPRMRVVDAEDWVDAFHAPLVPDATPSQGAAQVAQRSGRYCTRSPLSMEPPWGTTASAVAFAAPTTSLEPWYATGSSTSMPSSPWRTVQGRLS